MPEFKLICPNCKKSLQINVAAQQSTLKIRCPLCQRELKINTSAAGASASSAPAVPQHDPFANLNDPALIAPTKFSASTYAGPARVKKKSSVPSKMFWLIGGGVVGLFALMAVGIAIWKFMPSSILPNLTRNEVASDEGSLGPPIPTLPWRSESVDDLGAEISALAGKTQESISALPEAELATTGVERLKVATKQFEDMFYRVVNATPKSIDLKAIHEGEQRAKQAVNGPPPAVPANYIWTLAVGGDSQDPWTSAKNEVSSSRINVEGALASRVQYPDPLKETSGLYDWSTEDRRVLSAYWLQGELERDFATELLACLREKVGTDTLQDRCGAVIDRYVPRAIELAKVISTQGTLMIKVPKGTVYERHAISTRSVLLQLKERHPHPAIDAIIKEATDVSGAIEDIQFQRGGRLLDYAKTTTRERLVAIREAELKEKLAQEEQSRQQEIKLAEERAAKKAAEEKERERQAAELAKRQQENQSQNNLAQGSASGSAAPAPVPPGFNGQPIGMSGRPFGPGRGADMSQNPSFPQAPLPPSMPSSPNGPVPRETPAPGSNPADAGQASVKIRIAQATNEQYQQVAEAIKSITGNYSTSMSNGKVELQISQYTGSLADLATKLPMLKFEKTDEATRTIDATFR